MHQFIYHNGLTLVLSTAKMLASFALIHNNFLTEVSRTMKIQNLDHPNWSDFSAYIFFFARLNKFLYILVFHRQISECRFLNQYVLIRGFFNAGFYCITGLNFV